MKFNFRFLVSVILSIAALISATTVSVYADTTSTDVSTSANIESIKFEKNQYTLMIGESVKPNIITNPAGAELPSDTIYSSADKKIATVDKNGKITAVSAGNTNIMVYIPSMDISASAHITVVGNTPKPPVNADYELNTVPNSTVKLISGFAVGKKVNEVKESLEVFFDTTNIVIQNADGTTAKDTALIATGMNILTDSSSCIVVIKGDIDGDGKITYDDTRTLVKYLSGASGYPNDAFLEAAVVNGSYVIDNELPTVECSLLISKHVMGKYKIEQ